MSPHATALPLPKQFYARNPWRDVFDIGPFLTREAAIAQAPGLSQMAEGQKFEVGILIAYRASIDAMVLLDQVMAEAREVNQDAARDWANSLSTGMHRGTDPHQRHAWLLLQDALQMAFQGWLTQHELHPAFGSIHEVTEHVAGAPADPDEDAPVGNPS